MPGNNKPAAWGATGSKENAHSGDAALTEYDASHATAQASERAVADDRAWFARHPGETRRYRRACDGEFAEAELKPAPPVPDGWPAPELWVAVRQVFPGLRIRSAYWFLQSPGTFPVLDAASGWALAALAEPWGNA